MKPKYRMMKLTCVVEITCEDGRWVAKSDSLKMSATGETPDGAVDNLKRNLQTAEDAARKPKVAYESKTKKVEAEPAKEAEQVATSEDTQGRGYDFGESERDLRSEVEGATIAELRIIAGDLGIEYDGLTKVPLREAILEKLDADEASD